MGRQKTRISFNMMHGHTKDGSFNFPDLFVHYQAIHLANIIKMIKGESRLKLSR